MEMTGRHDTGGAWRQHFTVREHRVADSAATTCDRQVERESFVQEALFELTVLLVVFFVPMLLLGAGLEWLARRKPTWAGIKFYVSDWEDLELGSDGNDAQLADPLAPWTIPTHKSADSTPVAFPLGPEAGGVRVAGHAHDTAGQQTSGAYLGGHGHEAASLEMFGHLLVGGAGNDTRSEGMVLPEDPGSIVFDTRRQAPDGHASGGRFMRRSPTSLVAIRPPTLRPDRVRTKPPETVTRGCHRSISTGRADRGTHLQGHEPGEGIGAVCG